MIGLALGLAIWSATAMIVGWATGKWGLLGTPKDESIANEWLNYGGIALALVSLFLFLFVETNTDGYKDSMEIMSIKEFDLPPSVARAISKGEFPSIQS